MHQDLAPTEEQPRVPSAAGDEIGVHHPVLKEASGEGERVPVLRRLVFVLQPTPRLPAPAGLGVAAAEEHLDHVEDTTEGPDALARVRRLLAELIEAVAGLEDLDAGFVGQVFTIKEGPREKTGIGK